MVKTKRNWFAAPSAPKERNNPLDVAILTLRWTKFSSESVALGSKIAADLIDCYNKMLSQNLRVERGFYDKHPSIILVYFCRKTLKHPCRKMSLWV